MLPKGIPGATAFPGGTRRGPGHHGKRCHSSLPATSRSGRQNAFDDAASDHHAFRGKAYFTSGEKDKSLADCNEAIRLDPTRPHPYNHIATIHADQKEPIPDAISDHALAQDRYDAYLVIDNILRQ